MGTTSNADLDKKSNYLSARDLILRIEAEGDLFSFKYGDVPLWWFVRGRLLWLLKREQSGLYLIRPAESLPISTKIRKAFDAIVYSARIAGGRSKGCDVLALSTSSARRQLTPDGKGFDVFFDFLSDLPDLRYTVVEFPDHVRHSPKPYSTGIMYGDSISLAGNLGRTIARLRHFEDDVYDLSQRVNDLLREHDQQLRPTLVHDLVCREAAYVEFTKSLVRRLLDAVKPRIVLTESGTSPTHMVVQYEAKRRGIPVLELQHGLITENHLGYFFCLNDPALLRASPFPDKICVYGEYFKETLRENTSLHSQNVVIIGDPYLWREYQTRRKLNQLVGRDGILITSQPGLGRFWSRFAVDLSERLGRSVILKPHPGESDNLSGVFSEALSSHGVEVVRDSRSIYDLFAQARYHLSVFSTSHFEAIAFGLNDVVVAKDGLEQQISVLIHKGIPLARSVEDAARIISDYPRIHEARSYVRETMFGLHLNPVERIRELLGAYLTRV